MTHISVPEVPTLKFCRNFCFCHQVMYRPTVFKVHVRLPT